MARYLSDIPANFHGTCWKYAPSPTDIVHFSYPLEQHFRIDIVPLGGRNDARNQRGRQMRAGMLGHPIQAFVRFDPPGWRHYSS